MRIGYCSPFNPMKSGISDFSEELVLALKKHEEVVIFSPVKPCRQELAGTFEIHDLSELDNKTVRESLDEIVYHVGNSAQGHAEIVEKLRQYLGIVELHDFGLHHLTAEIFSKSNEWEDYVRYAEYCHGKTGKKIAEDFVRGIGDAPWDRFPLEMSMNRAVLEKATAVIVHSEFTKQMVLGLFPDKPIVNIMLHSSCSSSNSASEMLEARKQLNLPDDRTIIGSFGFANTQKRIQQIIQALEKVKKDGRQFMYVLVGEADRKNISKAVEEAGLSGDVIVTGFVSLCEFDLYLKSCDFCINLRYPTQGESSASLHRMLGMGKPAIVTDVGTFSDYPDDVVLKVRYDEHEVDDIYRAVSLLAGNRKELQKRGRAALEYARTYCDLEKNAKRYSEFFQQVHDHTWQPDYEDTLITRLCELGLTDEGYTRRLYNTVFSAI